MTQKKFTEKTPSRNILKMPKPVEKIEQLQQSMDSEFPDYFQIHARRVNHATGNVTLDISVSPPTQEEADEMVKRLTIKPHRPGKDTIGDGKTETKLLSVDGQNLQIQVTLIHPRNRVADDGNRSKDDAKGRGR